MNVELREGHVYFIGGTRYPGVTEILEGSRLQDPYNGDPKFGERGTAVHEATAIMDRHRMDPEKFGALNPDTVDDRIPGFLTCWQTFVDMKAPEPILIEEPLGSTRLGFCGTPDGVYRIGKDLWLLDKKTTAGKAETHHLQTGAYTLLYCEREKIPLEKIKRGAVYLNDKGELPVLVPHEDPRDFQVFRGAIAVADWHRRKGK